MPSLVLEGGTMRPIFSAGVMDALLDNNIIFPYCIGVSAGITNGMSYLSKQKRRNLDILINYRNDKRYFGYGNFIKCKSIFGLDFAFDEIPNKLNPFDMKEFLSYEGKALIGVTNAKTGKTEYMDAKLMDNKCTLLRATCALPLYFPAIKIGDNLYYDGGICDPIPIKKAIADGNEKHLILLTQPKGYIKKINSNTKIVAKLFKRKYPNLEIPLLTRHNHYNDTVAFCESLEKDGKAVIIRPRIDQRINSFEKNIDKLTEAYNNGYNACIENLDKIKQLFA